MYTVVAYEAFNHACLAKTPTEHAVDSVTVTDIKDMTDALCHQFQNTTEVFFPVTVWDDDECVARTNIGELLSKKGNACLMKVLRFRKKKKEGWKPYQNIKVTLHQQINGELQINVSYIHTNKMGHPVPFALCEKPFRDAPRLDYVLDAFTTGFSLGKIVAKNEAEQKGDT